MKRALCAVPLLALFWANPSYAQQQVKPGNLPTLNNSVVITTGNTFQTVLTAATGAAPRNSLTIQNNNASDSCWLSFGSVGGTAITAGNATKGKSILLTAGQAFTRYLPYIPVDEIEGTCATSADTLYIDVQ